jgi:hypothetical protein
MTRLCDGKGADMSEQEIETVRLLARFKLQVRRSLDRGVDLKALAADPAYAEEVLADVEERAEDEELLVLVLRLRKRLLPARAPSVVAVAVPAPVDEVPVPAARPARDYRFGARGG